MYSQSVCGIDISDPYDTSGYVFNNALDAANTDVYLKNDPGLFDRVLLNRSLGYVCTINYPNANRFSEIYDDLVKNFGFENEIKDVIPEGVIESDIIEIALLILEGRAQIIRYWFEKKFNIKLDYSQKNLQLYISYF
ncbi:MAG TPA: hypothetical protein PKE39_15005 [Ignavibacteria bacterium]|nr:hypothetical protein [Ignavibacteria bacterium]HMR00329.1 hypothetical protein [Ignavibacteria bacterium]